VRLVQAARGASLSSDPAPDEAAHAAQDAPDDASHPAPVEPPTGPRRVGVLAAVAVPVVVLDVVTKVLVVARLEDREPVSLLGGRLLLQVTRNPGAAFSFATDATAVFTTIAVVVIAAILWSTRTLRSAGWAVALGLVLAGATGNLVDRVFRTPGPGRGAVVDFIDFRVWPSFNVADSAIVIGGLLAVLLSLKGIEIDGRRTTGRRAAQPTGPASQA
jgi:signal peptidase II